MADNINRRPICRKFCWLLAFGAGLYATWTLITDFGQDLMQSAVIGLVTILISGLILRFAFCRSKPAKQSAPKMRPAKVRKRGRSQRPEAETLGVETAAAGMATVQAASKLRRDRTIPLERPTPQPLTEAVEIADKIDFPDPGQVFVDEVEEIYAEAETSEDFDADLAAALTEDLDLVAAPSDDEADPREDGIDASDAVARLIAETGTDGTEETLLSNDQVENVAAVSEADPLTEADALTEPDDLTEADDMPADNLFAEDLSEEEQAPVPPEPAAAEVPFVDVPADTLVSAIVVDSVEKDDLDDGSDDDSDGDLENAYGDDEEDDLTDVEGVDDDIAVELYALGINSVQQLATLPRGQVLHFAEVIPNTRRDEVRSWKRSAIRLIQEREGA
jgi:hypothetical protein